mmetsp:Transcript_2887/g.3048  ORF Transcript_2887/g.3048 Transcript_2887/m.3048 type:complete len:98 (-) Transcript_2887:308-601(-)
MAGDSDPNMVIARQMFFIGCLGLPWLWLVNVIYFTPLLYNGEASAGLRLWYFRSLTGAAIAFTALFVWITILQTSWRSWENPGKYMIYVPDEDRTGW